MRRRVLLNLTPLVGLFALGSCGENTTSPETAAVQGHSLPVVAAAANTWIRRADMPSTARWNPATATVTNAAGQSILYAIGGRVGFSGSLSKVQAYNVATNTWRTRAPLPRPLYWTNGVGVIGGKLYISGGLAKYQDYRTELYVYNPRTNTWTEKTSMPNTSYQGVTGVIKDKLYVYTGCAQEDCTLFESELFYRYDPVTDQWTSLPTPGTHGGSRSTGGVIGGKFYVARDDSPFETALDVYDPATNQWTPKVPGPSAGNLYGRGVALRGKLYIVGSPTIVYDPATNTWSRKAPIPRNECCFSASRVVFQGQPRIEVVGGGRPGNNLQYIP